MISNFNTVKNIFLKLGTNIKHYLMMCKEKEPYAMLFMELCPFEIISLKIVHFIILKSSRIFS